MSMMSVGSMDRSSAHLSWVLLTSTLSQDMAHSDHNTISTHLLSKHCSPVLSCRQTDKTLVIRNRVGGHLSCVGSQDGVLESYSQLRIERGLT